VRASLAIILIASVATNLSVVIADFALSQSSDTYSYRFEVDNNGSTLVTITYISSEEFGSSWVIVPKFLEFTNQALRGRILDFSLKPTTEKLTTDYYFYSVLDFSFASDGYFEMMVQYNFTTAAMIIEPYGIFLSPQIGYQSDGSGKAEVTFPSNFKVQKAVAEGGYSPSFKDSNYVRFDNLPSTPLRLEIDFNIEGDQPSPLKIERGIFAFETSRRYEKYALNILSLFNRTYDDLVDLFNTTLENIDVEFFVPDFKAIYSIGGYVPFTGETIGNIHINIFYTRYVEGYIEVTALHELVHHFLWRAGISPEALLWFHEGMAQYVSVEMSEEIGLEGASMIKQELENAARRLSTIDDLARVRDLGFLLRWTPSSRPADWGTLYTAAYYVVTRLADPYGELDYYARLFKLLNEIKVEDNDELAYYLSLASNETVMPTLRAWGFDVVDLYTYSTLIMGVERSIQEVSPLYQPYKFFAEQLYRWALVNARQDRVNAANGLLLAAVIIAKLSPLLTLVTVSGTLYGAILYALKRKGLFSDQPL
jgi:hypothetical protein